MEKTEVDVTELWEQYAKSHDASVREQLILHYAPLVKLVVGRLWLIESPMLQYQDLISSGMSGLLEAVDRFDPHRGVSFETFATQRIRGSVLDALRALDYVSRSVRRRSAEIERAIVELRNRLGRAPSDHETADYMGMAVSAYREVLSQVSIVFLPLDSPLGNLSDDGKDMLLSEALEDPSMRDVTLDVEERDLRLELTNAIRELPEREQLVLSLYYYEELTVREVAEILDLSPSRISQLLARSIMMLRARLVYDMPPAADRRRVRNAPAAATRAAVYEGYSASAYRFRSHVRGR